MGIRLRLIACACVAMSVCAPAVAQRTSAPATWTTTITSGRLVGCHESPCVDDVEGIVRAQDGASRRCVAHRAVLVVEKDTGRVVGEGTTSKDGSFRIPSDDQTFKLVAQAVERRVGRHGQNVCAAAQSEVSLFVE
jgi:hypothetical protein